MVVGCLVVEEGSDEGLLSVVVGSKKQEEGTLYPPCQGIQ